MTFNKDKSLLSTKEITLLGHIISKGTIKPNPDRLQPLFNLAPPSNLEIQRRYVGMFSYYSKWIFKFSEKIYPLIHNTEFPIPDSVLEAYNTLKEDIANAVVCTIDENEHFEIETDASDHAIAASLNQSGRPVAFFSRTLSSTEQKHSSVEKEAQAIVEAVKYWKHYLQGRYFKLLTD